MIDLHTHSNCSDGTDPPERIPELAAAAGCRAVALTDHDTLVGLGAAQKRADELSITLVPGCEVSCALGEKSAHVLVYFVEPGEGPFQDELVHLQDDRVTRNRLLADRLAELGMPIPYEEMVAEAAVEESVGRPHVAALLVRHGYADSIPEAFDRWIGSGRPAHVPKARLTPGEAATLAKSSGGVAVLAHPLTLELPPAQLRSVVGELAEAGLAGIEVTYASYSPEEREGLAAIARECDLVATGGSDYHGTVKVGLSVGSGRGDLDVPDVILDKLAARRPAA